MTTVRDQIAARAVFLGMQRTSSSPGGSSTWGGITGTLTDQTDLVAAIAAALASANSYTDAATVGLWDDRGLYDASGNVFPSSGGSGTAGAILKGDLWTISVSGTLGGHVVTPGDTIRALVDTPGSTDANWAILENNTGYVAENAANKTGTINGSSTSTQYPHAQAVYSALALKQDRIPICTAGGTADALTLNFSPDFAFGDLGLVVALAIYDNATSTPTAAADGGAPFVIKKKGGQALVPGDIKAGMVMLLASRDIFSSQWWELMNPAYDSDTVYTDEKAMDAVAAMIAAGTHSGVTISYNDAGDAISFTVTGGSGSSDAIVKSYTQTAHGLIIGQPVYWNGTLWVIADADSDTTAARGFVSTVTDANTIVVTFGGRVTATAAEWLARTEDGGNLVAGETYWLSTTAGKITKTQPVSGFSQELGYAESTTVFVVSVAPVVGLQSAYDNFPIGAVVNRAFTQSATVKSTTDTTIPRDNTKPQNTEGVAWSELDTTITPKSATSKLRVTLSIGMIGTSISASVSFAVFRDSGADAVWATIITEPTAGQVFPHTFVFYVDAGSVSASTFKVRWSTSAGTAYLNQNNGATPFFNGLVVSLLDIEEVKQ